MLPAVMAELKGVDLLTLTDVRMSPVVIVSEGCDFSPTKIVLLFFSIGD
jgi:hypothetical protein